MWLGLCGLALAAAAAWQRRVPLQNVVLASGLIGLLATIWVLAGWVAPVTFRYVPLALAAILSARMAAARGLRSYRSRTGYGYWLTGVATALGSLPLLLTAFARPALQRPAVGLYGSAHVVLVLASLLLTLPCYLDKRLARPEQETPWPAEPVGIWLGTVGLAWVI